MKGAELEVIAARASYAGPLISNCAESVFQSMDIGVARGFVWSIRSSYVNFEIEEETEISC